MCALLVSCRTLHCNSAGVLHAVFRQRHVRNALHARTCVVIVHSNGHVCHHSSIPIFRTRCNAMCALLVSCRTLHYTSTGSLCAVLQRRSSRGVLYVHACAVTRCSIGHACHSSVLPISHAGCNALGANLVGCRALRCTTGHVSLLPCMPGFSIGALRALVCAACEFSVRLSCVELGARCSFGW